MLKDEPNPCKCCGATPRVMSGGPGCAWIKCECGMETTDGSLPRVLAIWNRTPSSSINWRDDPAAIVEDDEPMVGRDYA